MGKFGRIGGPLLMKLDFALYEPELGELDQSEFDGIAFAKRNSSVVRG
jgi:hypothetical protein